MGDIYAENLKVTVIIPDENVTSFWELVTENSQAAAKTLGVDLEVIYSKNSRFEHKIQIEKIVQRERKPDYVIIRPYQGTIKATFTLLEQNKIPFVTLERTMFKLESDEVALPRQNYKYWIGQIIYNNAAGGKLLKDALAHAFFIKNPNKVMRITGIGGSYDALSLLRQSPLEQSTVVNKDAPIVINQIFPMMWDTNRVNQIFSQILNKYPKTNTFWCVSDAFALEIFNQLKIRGIDNILIGGFDWVPKALKEIESGNLTASVGGHFLMAASALVKIVDYHQGIDRFLLPPYMNSYELITQDNVSEYSTFINDKGWNEVDFSVFLHSKYLSKPPKLSLNNMIKQQEH